MQPLGENSINVPAFLGKLWKMVNDPNTDHLICWGEGGKSFVIQNQAQFWYELLPLYYKHNNMSSFVRQLNMYGFHKISSVENGTMDADKDEIIFFHPYFKKDEPELLKNIKRKVTVSKHNENSSQPYRHDDLTKVLTDVKQIRGRQASVDSELTAMKQENTVLWRELAILRQKHLKQQQIVNKLIQFLVTLVQPPRMGVGVKRRFPMLHGSPAKRTKSKPSGNNTPHSSEGPTIHELDSELDINTNQLYEDDIEENTPMDEISEEIQTEQQINSPQTPATSIRDPANSPSSSTSMLDEAVAESIMPETLGWDKPEMVDANDIENYILSADSDENINETIIDTLNDVKPNIAQCSGQKVFLNPNTQDTLLSNLINGSYNVSSVSNNDNGKNENGKKSNAKQVNEIQDDNPMAVATREPLKRIKSTTLGANGCYSNDLDLHLESTQSELNQLKDLLNGYNSFDANALLGELYKIPQFKEINLFNHDSPDLELTYPEDGNEGDSDPLLVSTDIPTGSELTTYGNNVIDFNELLDESLDNNDIAIAPNEINPQIGSINTPLIGKEAEPIFPSTTRKS